MGIPPRSTPDSIAFQVADTEILALTISCIVLLFIEFFTLTFGISTVFQKVNVFQILFHFIGCIHLSLMVLIRYNYKHMRPIIFFYVIIPVFLELSVLCMAYGKFKVMGYIQDNKVKRGELLQKEIKKRTEAHY